MRMLSSEEGRQAAARALEDGMLAPSTRAAKEAKLNVLLRFAAAAGVDLFPITPGKLNPILGAMKLAGYRSTAAYLGEARVRHVQLRHPVPEHLKQYFKDAARSVVRGRGPVKRAPVVKLESLVESNLHAGWTWQGGVAAGPVSPWDAFVVSCWWMLRGAEAVALRRRQCSLTPGDKVRAEIRLGATKTDIEGVGRRRCFLCICARGGGTDALCPACSLRRLLDQGGAGEDPLLRGPGGRAVDHSGLLRVWRDMLCAAQRFDDVGDAVGAEVTEHTPRRAGAQFHARRGLALWQIQYLGRWGSNTVEIYVGEAFADLRACWSEASGDSINMKKLKADVEEAEVAWSDVVAQVRKAWSLAKDVEDLRKELETFRDKDAGWARDWKKHEEEMEDLVDEATQDGTVDVTAEAIIKLKGFVGQVSVVNTRTCTSHAVDLKALAAADPATWAAACGWRIKTGDAVFKVGLVIGNVCAKSGCAQKMQDFAQDVEDEVPEDELQTFAMENELSVSSRPVAGRSAQASSSSLAS